MNDDHVAADQGTEKNPWPHPKPDYMTDTHVILLKAFWKEGMTPDSLTNELHECVPTLSPMQCKRIVAHWMWNYNIVVKQ